MHRTRLRQFVIDCTADTYNAATAFWAGAVGAEPVPVPDEPEYVELSGQAGDLSIGMQRLGDGPSRVHLDIESDDIEAEVARLVGLGATEVERIRSWVVLRDPAGLPFCVIRAQPGFEEGSTTWE